MFTPETVLIAADLTANYYWFAVPHKLRYLQLQNVLNIDTLWRLSECRT